MSGEDSARYLPCALKRLTDFEPGVKKERFTPVVSMRQVKEDVYENVSMLFLSRSHRSPSELKNDPEIEHSVLGYGLPDYCGKICDREDRENLRETIVRQLKTFEPRIAPDSIAVEFEKTAEDADVARLEFKISGKIRVGPVSEDIIFRSKINMEDGRVDLDME
jgi:type VI secretion system protein ImpF